MSAMSSADPAPSAGGAKRVLAASEQRPRPERLLALPFGLTLLFLLFVSLPPIRTNPRLLATFVAVGSVLLFWLGILFAKARKQGRRLTLEFVPVKSHYVQACVQLCVYAYFGWYWRNLYREVPLILSQIVFLYVLDQLLSWSRRDNYRLGFGPLPIILGTNLFMWFRDDWFIFQFLMVATGALGKEFIRWHRDGKRTHVFNPSVFGLCLFSVALILTGTTGYTHGEELATMLGAPPLIYLEIFLVGLVVQFFFSVTLMTLSATAAICLLNLLYTASTGVYHFVDSNIPIAVFLGLHLLMTDPSTSPRTNLGRVIFGSCYGIGVFLTYALLTAFGAPRFYDKLLVVPLLNLSVQAIDRFARSGVMGRFTRWEANLHPGRLNLVHMAGWAVLFFTLLGTGFVQARHPGESVAFWKKAAEEKRPRALSNLVTMLEAGANQGSGTAANELGLIYADGKLTPANFPQAVGYFQRGCDLGNLESCANVAIQFLFSAESKAGDPVNRAFDRLEAVGAGAKNGNSCYLLGLAYETGRGRSLDLPRARQLYAQACELGEVGACKNLGRMLLQGQGGPPDSVGAAHALEQACDGGDAQSCYYLAPLYHLGDGVAADDQRALALLRRACDLGLKEACDFIREIGRKAAFK